MIPDVPRIDMILEKGAGMPTKTYMEGEYKVTKSMVGKRIPAFNMLLEKMSHSSDPIIATSTINPIGWPVMKYDTIDDIVLDSFRNLFTINKFNIQAEVSISFDMFLVDPSYPAYDPE
jgi:hypothetical protein